MSLGFGGLVFIILLVLKLTGLAAISWFWVFLPLWAGIALWVLFIGCGVFMYAVGSWFSR